jgi:hypothetical protein
MNTVVVSTICAAEANSAVYQAQAGGPDVHNDEILANQCGANQVVIGAGCHVEEEGSSAGWNFKNGDVYECGGSPDRPQGSHKSVIGICMDPTLQFGDWAPAV